jgi:hypothetical protein
MAGCDRKRRQEQFDGPLAAAPALVMQILVEGIDNKAARKNRVDV